MHWNSLENTTQIDNIRDASQEKPVLLFKHSTRCPISSTALNRLERAWNEQEMSKLEPYYLDLIAFRPVSNQVAESFDVMHQSPQVLLIHKGNCVYHTSHLDISYATLKEQLKRLEQ